MLRVRIDRVIETEETVEGRRDPHTGKFYESQYRISGPDAEKIWERSVCEKILTGRKSQQITDAYEQTVDIDDKDDNQRIQAIIKAANNLS